MIQGGKTTGELLSTHQAIQKISLTGQVATGKKVMAAASANLKHVTMELGGKSPIIVFSDADIDESISAVMLGNFYTQGEICSNGTRVFVEEKDKKYIYRKIKGTF